MFEKLSDNLNLLMAEVHISADELARRTGIPASTIKKIRNRYNPNPTLTTLLPLADFFAVTLGQLVGNEPLIDSRLRGLYKPNTEKMLRIPILSWEEAITWPDTINESHIFISTEYEYSKVAFALVVQEDDWGNLAKGTALLIDPILKAAHRDYVIIIKEGQTLPTVKQVLLEDGQIYLKSLIQGYNILAMTPDYKFLGVVVEYKKHLKMPN